VEIIKDNDKGSVLAISNQEIPYGFKGPGPLFFRFKIAPGLIVRRRGKNVLKSGEGVKKLFVKFLNPFRYPLFYDISRVSFLNIKKGS